MTGSKANPKKAFYESLPKKRMAVGVLLFSDDKLLLVKPGYKNHWSVPGGVVEENESLFDACLRETKEEIGLDIKVEKLLCVDYMEANGEVDENLQFIFSGGQLDRMQINNIKVDGEEITEYKFAEPKDAFVMLSDRLQKRIRHGLYAMKHGATYYLENGRKLF